MISVAGLIQDIFPDDIGAANAAGAGEAPALSTRSVLGRIRQIFSDSRNGAESPEERLEEIIDEAEREGLIDDEASEMVQGILDLSNTTAAEVMVPRISLSAVPDTISVADLLASIVEFGHSRIPVYSGSVDRIIGILYVKDLFRFWGRDDEVRLADVMREPYFIPESKPLSDLLTEFKARKIQLAVVVDEYGGTSGLVSMEDILEMIVGDIADEYDTEEDTELLRAEDGHVVASGRLAISDLADHFDTEAPEGGFTTVGGWISDRIGRVPDEGEEFEFDGFQVRVESADPRQIKTVSVAYVGDTPLGPT